MGSRLSVPRLFQPCDCESMSVRTADTAVARGHEQLLDSSLLRLQRLRIGGSNLRLRTARR